MALNTYLLIITLNVNGLNAQKKRHRVSEWIKKKKKDSFACCLKETHFRPNDACRSKVKGLRMIYHANGCQKKARVATVISDKLDFKPNIVTRDEEGHYIIAKGNIQQ